MSQDTFVVGSKRVRLSQPYRAPTAPLVGREPELRLVTAAWIAGKENLPLSPLIHGQSYSARLEFAANGVARTREWTFTVTGNRSL